ncbi:hypothetical protein NS277_16220, partial [Novosphingobium barchaimii]
MSPSAPTGRQRDDLLISIALSAPPRDADQLAQLSALARSLDSRFRYWEMLIAFDPERDGAADVLQAAIPNLRLLHLRPGARAAAAGSEWQPAKRRPRRPLSLTHNTEPTRRTHSPNDVCGYNKKTHTHAT